MNEAHIRKLREELDEACKERDFWAQQARDADRKTQQARDERDAFRVGFEGAVRRADLRETKAEEAEAKADAMRELLRIMRTEARDARGRIDRIEKENAELRRHLFRARRGMKALRRALTRDLDLHLAGDIDSDEVVHGMLGILKY